MSTDLQHQTKQPLTIREQLKSPALLGEIAKALPSHMSADRMARVAITALTRTPKLADCTQASFFRCLLDLSAMGLEPDGRRAHLIPYKNECTLIVDYKGIVELCYRSGSVSAIHADVVHEGDSFGYSLGRVLDHTPWFLLPSDSRPKECGKPIAAYCIVKMKGGTEKHEVMSFDEIESIRKRSRAGSNGPWITDWNEMAKKTVFRRCSKWLPWSAEIVDAIERDDDVIETTATATAPRPSATTLDALIAPLKQPEPQEQAEPECEPVAEGEYTEAYQGEPEPPQPQSDPMNSIYAWQMRVNEASGIAELDNLHAKLTAALGRNEVNAADAGKIAEMIAEKKKAGVKRK